MSVETKILSNVVRGADEDGIGTFSGIGIALLGASGMEVTANHLWGNVPSGPTRISGG